MPRKAAATAAPPKRSQDPRTGAESFPPQFRDLLCVSGDYSTGQVDARMRSRIVAVAGEVSGEASRRGSPAQVGRDRQHQLPRGKQIIGLVAELAGGDWIAPVGQVLTLDRDRVLPQAQPQARVDCHVSACRSRVQAIEEAPPDVGGLGGQLQSAKTRDLQAKGCNVVRRQVELVPSKLYG